MRLVTSAFLLAFSCTSLWAACMLTWDAPATDILGNPMGEADIAAYRLYVKPKSQAFVKGEFVAELLGDPDALTPPDKTVACSAIGFTSGKHVVVTAVSTSLDESGFSNVVVRHIPGPPENARKEEE